MILGLAFPGALAVSMPYWAMPAAPRRAQWCVVGVVLTILTAIGLVTVQLL